MQIFGLAGVITKRVRFGERMPAYYVTMGGLNRMCGSGHQQLLTSAVRTPPPTTHAVGGAFSTNRDTGTFKPDSFLPPRI